MNLAYLILLIGPVLTTFVKHLLFIIFNCIFILLFIVIVPSLFMRIRPKDKLYSNQYCVIFLSLLSLLSCSLLSRYKTDLEQ